MLASGEECSQSLMWPQSKIKSMPREPSALGCAMSKPSNPPVPVIKLLLLWVLGMGQADESVTRGRLRSTLPVSKNARTYVSERFRQLVSKELLLSTRTTKTDGGRDAMRTSGYQYFTNLGGNVGQLKSKSMEKKEKSTLYHYRQHDIHPRFRDKFKPITSRQLRRLSNHMIGSFDNLNNRLRSTVIHLPDISDTIPFEILAASVDVSCRNILAGQIGLRNVQRVSYYWRRGRLNIDVAITGIEADVSFDFSFTAWWLGIFSYSDSNIESLVNIRNGEIEATFSLRSPNFGNALPNKSEVTRCNADITIVDYSLQDYNQYKSDYIQQVISDLLSSDLCSMLQNSEELVDRYLNSLINIYQLVFPNYGAGGFEELELGQAISSQESVADTDSINSEIPTFLDFEKNVIVEWAVSQISTFLGTRNANTSDLAINKVISDSLSNYSFVNEDGWVVIPTNHLSSEMNGQEEETQSSGHISIEINAVEIKGLDSFSHIEPLHVVAPQVLRTHIVLNEVLVSAYLNMTIKSQQGSNPQVSVSGFLPLELDNVRIEAGMKMLNLTVALFLGIDTNRLGKVQIGSVLHTSTIISCILSTLTKVELVQFSYQKGEIVHPVLSGMLDDGIDDMINHAIKDASNMLSELTQTTIESTFRSVLQPILNDTLQQLFAGVCNETSQVLRPSSPSNSIDFRELLLGGREGIPSSYGDIIPILYGSALEILNDSGGAGMAKINKVMIQPLTENLSGVSGALQWTDNFVSLESEMDVFGQSLKIEVALTNVTIQHLDSVHQTPLKILHPHSTLPHVLETWFAMGTSERPLEGSVRLRIMIEHNSMVMNLNTYEVNASADAMEIHVESFVRMDEDRFLSFRLENVMNPFCWLAVVPPPPSSSSSLSDDNYAGDISNNHRSSSLGIKTWETIFANGTFTVECSSCVNEGNSSSSNFSPYLQSLLENLFFGGGNTSSAFDSFMEGRFVQSLLNLLLAESSNRCPQKFHR